jgi:catalase
MKLNIDIEISDPARFAAFVDAQIDEVRWHDGQEDEAGDFLLHLQELSRQLGGAYKDVPRDGGF